MKRTARRNGALPGQGAVPLNPDGTSFLIRARGRGRRTGRVFKWLGAAGAGPLRDRLRDDFLDLSSLSHPSLALPVAFGQDPQSGRAYLLRPYLDGAEISAALRARAPRDILPFLIAAAEALDILHRFGFLHGNLKAANLLVPRRSLLSRSPRDPQVVLCDPAWRPAPGEPSYSDDLHALGIIAYRLLAGAEARWPEEDGQALPLSAVNPAVPVDLERAVMKLLHPQPARRYQRAEELIGDLRRLSEGRVPAAPDPPECFLDRLEELSRVRALLACHSLPAVIAVTGEAGLGKSAFLRRMAREAGVDGWRVAAVRCFSPDSPPLSPVRELLGQLFPDGGAGRVLRARWRTVFGRAGTGTTGDGAGRRELLRGILDLAVESAAGRPALLMVDEAHLADPLTVAFLASLAVDAAFPPDANRSGLPPPPSLCVSFRGESPFRSALTSLREALERPAERSLMIELKALRPEVVEDWLDRARREQLSAQAARLSGHPYLLWQLLRGASQVAKPSPGQGRLNAAQDRFLQALTPPERRLLQAIALMARPARPELLSAVLNLPSAGLRPSLGRFLGDGTLVEERGGYFFQYGSFADWLVSTLRREEKRRLHGKIAAALQVLGGAEVEEVARHWLESETPRRGLQAGLAAARSLAMALEDRRALEYYRKLLDLLGPREERKRAEVEREMAEALARSGDHRSAIASLKILLARTNSSHRRATLLGRIGLLHHRAGEPAAAARRLEEARLLLQDSRGRRRLGELLRIESVLAEIACNRAEYGKAEAICRRALERLAARGGSAGDPALEREEMVLLETMAHLHLRRFQYREARLLFERSLQAGANTGCSPEASLVLNNLGTLHVQENRFPEAIDCYRRAEEISGRLRDDQSLATVLSNLAVLYSRAGDSQSAGVSLQRAERHDERCGSLRTRFLRLHCRGLVELTFGGYSSAIPALEEAIRLGEELGDHHLASFDLVYLGECRLYRGETRAAGAAFDRALTISTPSPAPVAAMVESRRALLCAQRGDRRAARAALEAARRPGGEGIPFVAAGNRLFLGWCLRLLGDREAARQELEAARAFFAGVGVPGGEIHAVLELAALEADSGRIAEGRERIAAIRSRETPGRGALSSPMLAARLFATESRLLLAGPERDERTAAALLREAESCLIGRKIRDLESLVRGLKRRLPARAGEAEGREISAGGPPKAAGSPPLFIGNSPAMRRIEALVRQAARSTLPVLITGETGTGKELVARAIHEEGPRRNGPFQSLNCAALPEGLLEAQLFGYRRGAFSGAEEDRPGLLQTAQGGTFLFDEVAEMPLPLQAKILRAVDRGQVRPVGAEEEEAVDVRYLFATNRDLRLLTDQDRFRRELLFRIAGLEIAVPPLRERTGDLPALIEHFRSLAAGGAEDPVFAPEAWQVLAAHSWPGNVRELRNVVSRLVLTANGRIGPEEARRLLGETLPGSPFSPEFLRSRRLPELQDLLEREYLVQLHHDHSGNLESMAASLNITLRALYGRFRRLKIRPSEIR